MASVPFVLIERETHRYAPFLLGLNRQCVAIEIALLHALFGRTKRREALVIAFGI